MGLINASARAVSLLAAFAITALLIGCQTSPTSDQRSAPQPGAGSAEASPADSNSVSRPKPDRSAAMDWPKADTLYAADVRSKRDQQVRQTLQKTVPADFDHLELEYIVEYVRNTVEINIFANWKRLEDAGVPRDIKIALQAKDLPVRRWLEQVLDQAAARSIEPIGMRVVDGVLVISSKRDLSNNIVSHTYVIDWLVLARTKPYQFMPDAKALGTRPGPAARRNLTKLARKLEGKWKGKANSSLFGEEDDDDRLYPTAKQARTELIELIQNCAGDPQHWGPGGVWQIETNGNTLSIAAPVHIHEEVAELLRQHHRAMRQRIEQRLSHNHVLRLVEDAQSHLIQDEYEKALQAARDAGNIDPNHPTAKAMHRMIKRAMQRQRAAEAKDAPSTPSAG